jgi:hypothetical protein
VRNKVATLAAFTLSTFIAYSADKPVKFKIQVVDNSSDLVGQRLVYQLKEKIRASHSMDLIPNCDNGCWRIIVYTLDKEPDDSALKGRATVFSVIWLGMPQNQPGTALFLDSTIGYCGSERVVETAENIIAHTDRLFSKMNAPPSG